MIFAILALLVVLGVFAGAAALVIAFIRDRLKDEPSAFVRTLLLDGTAYFRVDFGGMRGEVRGPKHPHPVQLELRRLEEGVWQQRRFGEADDAWQPIGDEFAEDSLALALRTEASYQEFLRLPKRPGAG